MGEVQCPRGSATHGSRSDEKRRALASSPPVSVSDDKPRLRDGLLPLGKGCSSVARAPTRKPRIAVAGAIGAELRPAVAGAVWPELGPAVTGAGGRLRRSGRGHDGVLIRNLGAEGQRGEEGKQQRFHVLYQFLHERTTAAAEIYRFCPFFRDQPDSGSERKGGGAVAPPPLPGIHDEKSVTQRGQLAPGQG